MQQTTPSIQSSLQLAKSINSMNQTDLSMYKIPNNDNRRRDSNRYQKQMQIYNPQLKGRIVPMNISEKASQIAAASKIMSRADPQNSNLNTTNPQIVDHNLSYYKQIGNAKESNLRIGNFPIAPSTFELNKTSNPPSIQPQNDNSYFQINTQEKQQKESVRLQSHPIYSYRSIQSANHITEEQSNQSMSEQYSARQNPVQTFYQNQLINNSAKKQDRKYLSVDFSNQKNKINFINNSYIQATPETLPSTSQLKSGRDSINVSYNQPQQSATKFESLSNEKVKTQPDKYHFEDYCIGDVSDISVSKIDYQGSRGQSLRQSLINSGSFNFNQPSFIYNDDIRSKNTSVYTNSYLGFLSQAAANENKGLNRASYTTTTSNPDQKFIKQLIHKLHDINQNNHQNFSALDVTIEGSVQNSAGFKEEGVPNIAQSTTKTNNNNLKTSEYLLRQTRDNITPIKFVNKSVNISNQIINQSVDYKNQNDKIQSKFVSLSPEKKSPKKITIIRNTSKKNMTPLKAIHFKSSSQCNLQSISKCPTNQSLKLSNGNSNALYNSYYEKDFNELQQTEFSRQNSQNSQNSGTGQRKNKMFFSFSQQNNQQFNSNNIKTNQNDTQLKQTNQNQTTTDEVSTTSSRCNSGWLCC